MAKLLPLIALLFCALLAQTTAAKKKVASEVVKAVEPKDEKSASNIKATDIKDTEEDSDEEFDLNEDDFDKKEEPTPKALKKSHNPSSPSSQTESKTAARKSTKEQAETSKQDSKNESKTANKKSTKEQAETSKQDSKQNTDEDRFKLINFDKLLFSQSAPINQRWHKFGYTVRYNRDASNKLSLDWIKGKDKVIIRRKANLDIKQKWTFEDVNITISKVSSGEIKQTWKFGTSTYQYSRNPAGQVKSKWSKGKADTNTLEKYQKFIDRWCTDNDFLLPRAHCVIYDK